MKNLLLIVSLLIGVTAIAQADNISVNINGVTYQCGSVQGGSNGCECVKENSLFGDNYNLVYAPGSQNQYNIAMFYSTDTYKNLANCKARMKTEPACQ